MSRWELPSPRGCLMTAAMQTQCPSALARVLARHPFLTSTRPTGCSRSMPSPPCMAVGGTARRSVGSVAFCPNPLLSGTWALWGLWCSLPNRCR